MKEREIKELIDKILEITKFDGQAEVTKEEDIYRAQITTVEANRLIGKYGQVLLELEHIIRQILFKKIGEPFRFFLDINDYRKDKEAIIKGLAREYAQRAKNEGRVVAMQPMNAYERRLVHMILAEDDQVETFSEGENEERKVLIKPKKEFSL